MAASRPESPTRWQPRDRSRTGSAGSASGLANNLPTGRGQPPVEPGGDSAVVSAPVPDPIPASSASDPPLDPLEPQALEPLAHACPACNRRNPTDAPTCSRCGCQLQGIADTVAGAAHRVQRARLRFDNASCPPRCARRIAPGPWFIRANRPRSAPAPPPSFVFRRNWPSGDTAGPRSPRRRPRLLPPTAPPPRSGTSWLNPRPILLPLPPANPVMFVLHW